MGHGGKRDQDHWTTGDQLYSEKDHQTQKKIRREESKVETRCRRIPGIRVRKVGTFEFERTYDPMGPLLDPIG